MIMDAGVLICSTEVAWQLDGHTREWAKSGSNQQFRSRQFLAIRAGQLGRLWVCRLYLLFRFCEDLSSVYLGGRNRRGQGDGVWRCGCGTDRARGGTGPA